MTTDNDEDRTGEIDSSDDRQVGALERRLLTDLKCSDSELDDAAEVVVAQNEGEPTLNMNVPDGEDEAGEDSDDDEGENGIALREIVVRRRQAQTGLKYRPRYVVAFNDAVPGAQAGKAYDGNGVVRSRHGESEFSSFAEEVQALASSTSEYAPFLSKMEWDIACWVKANDVGANVLR